MFNIIIYTFINYINPPMKRESIDMCELLKKIYKKSPEFILDNYYSKEGFSVDIVSVAQNIGFVLGSADFTKLAMMDAIKNDASKKGNILGAVRVKGDNVQISYHNALYPKINVEYECLSDGEKRKNLIRQQRFTIAHEIAHCCLHMNPKTAKSHIEYRTDLDNGEDEEEKSANIFAGELLVPLASLNKLFLLLGNNIPCELLSELFNVSKHVIRARISYLKEMDKIPLSVTI